MEDVNHVVYAADNNYWMHMHVSIYSLLKNNINGRFKFYILADEIDKKAEDKIKLLCNKANVLDIKIIQVDSTMAESLPLSSDLPYVSKLTYYKFLIGKVLNNIEAKKALYIDCDTIIKGSISGLINIDLTERVIGAVPDLFWPDHSKRIGLPQGIKYFNAGMLLINLEEWRRMNTESLIADYVEQHYNKIEYKEQDVLNAILHNFYKEISPLFNYQVYQGETQIEVPISSSPIVINYIGHLKPWHYMYLGTYKNRYWYYLRETPYYNYRQEDRNFKNILVKNFVECRGHMVKGVRKIPFFYRITKKLCKLINLST